MTGSPLLLPIAGAMDIVRGLFADGTLIDLGALATTTGGQIYDPITGEFKAANNCKTELPCLGVAGGSLDAVLAFQEWDELVPPDPGDWDSNGGSEVVTDLGGGEYRVQLPDASGTYLRHAVAIGSADYTLSFEWRKTPGTSETGNASWTTVDGGASQ